jgi:hypothetical protein
MSHHFWVLVVLGYFVAYGIFRTIWDICESAAAYRRRNRDD